MLNRLTVSNLAVVERAEVSFAPGLNVLTGETGAGKSVLIGALELVLGGRADATVVREGAKEAEVEADFDGKVLRRTVTATGRSRAWVDEESVTLAELKAFGASLVDIHGPRANQKILEEAFQREVLDSYAGLGAAAAEDRRRTEGGRGAAAAEGRRSTEDGRGAAAAEGRRSTEGGRGAAAAEGRRSTEGGCRSAGANRSAPASGAHVRSAYDEAWNRLQAVRAARAALAEGGDVSDEIDLLKYQTGELEAAQLTEDDADLAERHAAAAHAGEILEQAAEVTEALGGDDGAADRLGRLQPVLASLARRLPAAAAWCAEAEELTVRIQELSRTVADAASALDADPGALEELDARLSLVSKLQRKYAPGGAVADLLAALEKKRTRLAELEGRGERLEELAREEKTALADVVRAGAALTKKRTAGAAKLAKAITRELRDLGFLKAEFAVALEPVEPCATGCDRVTFTFGPNPGEPARPLAAIASTGEAARVMLAVKVVLAAHDSTDVLVFDEIDANIGGETGSVVGAKLRRTAETHQVVAITHLPQSAAFGARHLVVTKRVAGGRTTAHVAEVEGEARVRELARMLGGKPGDKIVRAHAEKLLKN